MDIGSMIDEMYSEYLLSYLNNNSHNIKIIKKMY